jgi:hypothetical protein
MYHESHLRGSGRCRQEPVRAASAVGFVARVLGERLSGGRRERDAMSEGIRVLGLV